MSYSSSSDGLNDALFTVVDHAIDMLTALLEVSSSRRGGSFDENYEIVTSFISPSVNCNVESSLAIRLQKEVEMTSRSIFSQLQLDLIKHV